MATDDTNDLPDDATHPHNMSQDDLKRTLASLDDEDDEAEETGGDDDAASDSEPDKGGDAGEGKPEGEGEDATSNAAAADDGKPAGEEGKASVEADGAASAASDDDDGKIDKKAFNGVVSELRATRDEVKALKAERQSLLATPEARDFKAERAALKEKWDNGDLDTDDYNDQRDALVIEEAEYRSVVKFNALQQQQAAASANQAWQTKVGAWETANADFLANPIRKKAVSDLMAELDADPNNRLSDDELLQKVQEQAFEAFNWTGGTPAAAGTQDGAADPRAVAAARAAASASAAPPALAGGVGSAARSAKLDLEKLAANPSSAAGAKQAIKDALGEEA